MPAGSWLGVTWRRADPQSAHADGHRFLGRNGNRSGRDVRVPEPDDPDAPMLTLDGLAAFGGVSVGAKAHPTAES